MGFDVCGLAGERGILAHVTIQSSHHVGRYGVDLDTFERIVRSELNPVRDDAEVYLIDEIGKMECFSPVFIEAATRVLDSHVPVVATIAAKGGGFINQVKTRPDVEITVVTAENRDSLPARLAGRLSLALG